MIAHHLQEQTFGGLDRDNLTFLDSLARRGGPPRRQLKPGTVLVREYQGQRHTVTVACEGFDWQGATYPSLSAIARVITGTAWSGPRFFALHHHASGGAKPQRNSAVSVHRERHQRRPGRAATSTIRAGEPCTGTLETTNTWVNFNDRAS